MNINWDKVDSWVTGCVIALSLATAGYVGHHIIRENSIRAPYNEKRKEIMEQDRRFTPLRAEHDRYVELSRQEQEIAYALFREQDRFLVPEQRKQLLKAEADRHHAQAQRYLDTAYMKYKLLHVDPRIHELDSLENIALRNAGLSE
jgi:hypothetical protein